MGSIFRKTFTKPVPPGAVISTISDGSRVARWKPSKGRTKSAQVVVGKDGSDRISVETGPYYAKYRDHAGNIQVVPTGCKDETAARSVLADLERRTELIKARVMTPVQDAVSRHAGTPPDEHFDAYLAHLEATGTTPEHRKNKSLLLRRVAKECKLTLLCDLDRTRMENWLASQAKKGMGARTRNTYLGAYVSFCNWASEPEVGRLASNPFARMHQADEKADPRRKRRAMTEEELGRLLAVARERPLLDALTVRKGPRKGERYANVRPEVQERLQGLGRERALIYKTLVLSGLRKGELASLTVGQLHLDGEVCFAELEAADEKNREGNSVAIRADLANDLRDWLADKLRRLQAEARANGEPIPLRLPANTPVFSVPAKLCKILNRDLRMAKIAKRDERGRVLDVHALRHTFGTWLSKGGVAPRTAQAAMRHSKLELTMSVYTDPRLLDAHGALDVLPELPLDGELPDRQQAAKATGTDDLRLVPLAPTLAPTGGTRGQMGSIPDKMADGDKSGVEGVEIDVTSSPDKRKGRVSTADNRPSVVGATGLEPVTPSVSKRRSYHFLLRLN